MTSIVRRANPRQRKLLRIISGAVRNAAHHHPGVPADRLGISIAKRAVGTLTAAWPDVLATPRESSIDADGLLSPRRRHRKVGLTPFRKRGRAPVDPSPLARLQREVERLIAAEARAGRDFQQLALIGRTLKHMRKS